MKDKMLVMIILAIGGGLGGGIMSYSITPSSPCAGVAGETRSFAIIANLNGYNNSKSQPGSWHGISVHKCDNVAVTVVNNDVQSHGFSVEYYATKGMEVQGGQSQTVRFLATRAGEFRMFCNVFCTAHIYMQNGLLTVA